MLPKIRFELFGHELMIYSYGFMISLAILCGVFFIYKIWYEELKKPMLSVYLTILILISSLVGARLLYMFKNYEVFKEHVDKLFILKFKYFSLFGVMLFGGLALILLCYVYQVSFWRWIDKSVLALTISLVISRFGCLLNGCCFGRVTQVPWAIKVLEGSLSYQALSKRNPFLIFQEEAIYIHPTQVYEILAIIIAFFGAKIYLRIIGQVETARIFEGQLSIVYAILLSLGRFIAFWFRDPIKSEDISQIIGGPILYLILILGLLILYSYRRRQYSNN